MNTSSKWAVAMLLASAIGSAHAADNHYAVSGQIDGPEGAWTFASIDAAKHRLYVGRSGGILAVDLTTKKVTTWSIEDRRVQMVVPVRDSDLVVATQDQANSGVLVDANSGEILTRIPAGRRPEQAAYDPDSGWVAVMAGSAEVTLIDPKTKSAVASIPVEGILEGGVADGKGKLYINLENKNAIAIVDLKAKKQIGQYALPGCDGPTGLGFDKKTNLLLSSCSNHVAKLIDAASGADRGSIEISGGPDAVMVDEQRRRAFIACSEGRLSVIDLSGTNPKLLESVATARGAKTGALDPVSGKVYLPVGRAAETDFGGRAVPGFAVLVVESK